MNISIKRTSTLEANVSQRTVGYSVIVNGVIVASFEEHEDAKLFKEGYEGAMLRNELSKKAIGLKIQS